jgi:hypothetical protein
MFDFIDKQLFKLIYFEKIGFKLIYIIERISFP